jgi:hypothetical protein
MRIRFAAVPESRFERWLAKRRLEESPLRFRPQKTHLPLAAKASKVLGIPISHEMLLRADEVIE